MRGRHTVSGRREAGKIRARLMTVALIAVLTLPGCNWIRGWGEPEPGDPAELVKFEPSVKVRKIWSTDIGDGMGEIGLTMPPVYADGQLYAADYEGRLMAVDADDGRRIWEVKTKLPFSGGPGVGASLVVMGTIDGGVVAFNADSGSQMWTARVSSEVLAVPGVTDDVVVVRSIDGRVFGLDASNGARLWIYDHSVPLLTLRGNANILVRGSTVFVGYDDGSVSALRLDDGSLIWNQAIASPDGRTELERLADIGDQMVIVASDLIVSSYKNRVVSLAADSGRLLWFKEISSATGVQVDRTNLAVADQIGDVWLLDRRNGSTMWKIDQLTNRGVTRPAFYGDMLVVGDQEGYLHWIDLEEGRFVAREREGRNGFATAPLTVGTTLYVLTRKGNLAAYRAGAAL
ncbi:outer membrane protein assembly factor BamB [Elongatibacter sediminis]|uniref:Outer membrane protein assembly factor BamB n=1 Tax=Elongatibacter sediminis TaxID=3119006 RepID=A0AAW9RLB2_9GAMM